MGPSHHLGKPVEPACRARMFFNCVRKRRSPPGHCHGIRVSLMLRLLCLLVSSFLVSSPVHAADNVDLAIVLVTDVSRSIDDAEYKLEKEGYSAALTNPAVINAIQSGPSGTIAIAYVEFASSFEVRTVLDWTTIHDKESAQTFVDHLAAAPRSFWGRTAISSGIDRAVQLLAESGLNPTRRMIDVCGDGTNNAGRDVTEARDDALKAGITINGLAIINDHPMSWTFAHVQPPGGLPNYYRTNVTGGAGSFVLEVHDFHSFGEAMTRKLVTEIAGRAVPSRFATLP